MNTPQLGQEEQALLDAFEADEFESDLTEARRLYLAEAAEAVFKKDKRINIRISSRDLAALQRRALGEGLPYQTLVASVLHKYVWVLCATCRQRNRLGEHRRDQGALALQTLQF